MSAVERRRSAGAVGGDVRRTLKEVELEALANPSASTSSSDFGSDFQASVLPRSIWRPAASGYAWLDAIEQVVLVERLREVVAQVGFTRFESAGTDIDGELNMGVERAPLTKNETWLPAIENRGEGIFVQFRRDLVLEWANRPSVVDRATSLEDGFKRWKKEHHFGVNEGGSSAAGEGQGGGPPFPGAPYYMLHTLSHMLITAISLECGYPAAALRERIYALPSTGFAILIYTGSNDAEGTLGGLINAGRRIHHHLERALATARLCSNDPVCAFHVPAQHDHQLLHGSACHGCALIAET